MSRMLATVDERQCSPSDVFRMALEEFKVCCVVPCATCCGLLGSGRGSVGCGSTGPREPTVAAFSSGLYTHTLFLPRAQLLQGTL
jgi:hypothetical protein